MAVKKKGTGRRGGGTFSQFSNVNEASARSALTKGYRGGEKVASKYLKGGKGEIGGIKNIQDRYGTASDTIKSGYGTGRGDITASTGKQTGAINTGLDSSTGAVRSGAGNARYDIGDALNKSYGAVTSARDTALAGYDPYAKAGAAASNLYMGALGTDPTGHDAAVSAFHTSPGYEFQMGQGLDQLERRAAARGQLGSGNTSLDSITFSQGLADQDWSGWLDRLAAEQAMGVDVAGKTGAINTGAGTELANLYTGAGSALSGIDTGEGTSLSNLYTGAGTELANIYGAEGTNLANLSTGEAGKLSDLTTGLAGQESDYAKTMADLAYRTKMGLGQTQAGYLAGRDQTGANIVGGATGAVNTGINFFNPGAKKSTTSMAAG